MVKIRRAAGIKAAPAPAPRSSKKSSAKPVGKNPITRVLETPVCQRARTYPGPDDPVLCEIPAKVRDVWKIADPDSPRYAFHSVELERDAEGNCSACATEGRRLHVYTWNDGFIGQPFITLVPAELFRNAVRVLPKRYVLIGDRKGEPVSEPQEWGYQDKHQGTVVTKGKQTGLEPYSVEGRFPKWKNYGMVPPLSSLENSAYYYRAELNVLGLADAYSSYKRETTKVKLSHLFDDPKTPAKDRMGREGIRIWLSIEDDRNYELPLVVGAQDWFNGVQTKTTNDYQYGILRRQPDGKYEFDFDPSDIGIFNKAPWKARAGSSKIRRRLDVNFLFDVAEAVKSLGCKKLGTFYDHDEPGKAIVFRNEHDGIALTCLVMPIEDDNN